MNLRKELNELLALEDQKALFLSVYLNTSVNAEGQRNFPVFLRKKISLLAKLQEHGRENSAREFRQNVQLVEAYLRDDLMSDTRGVVIFCSVARDYFKALQLSVPVPNKFSVSTSPNLGILIELAEDNQHYCLAILDQHSGKILSFYLFDLHGEAELVDDTVPGRTKVGGWSQMRYQRHRRALIDHFMKEFAVNLEDYVRREGPDSIILLGTDSNLARFQRHLTADVRDRIVLTRSVPAHADDQELISQVSEYIKEAKSAAQKKAVDQLYDRLCQDHLAVVGLDDTLFNLQMGKLERLFISPQLKSSGFRCTNCQFIFSSSVDTCLYCQGSVEPIELRNRIEKLAEHHEVPIDVVQTRSFLDSLEGVGGFLRY